MRDPRDVIKGRIDAKINRKVYDAKLKARRGAENKVRGAVEKGKGAGSGAKKKKKKLKKKSKKKSMGWWPFGGKEEAAEVPSCSGCGNETDPSWGVCPYCGADLESGGAPAAAAPAGQPPVPNQPAPGGPAVAPAASNKTVAIDLEALKGPRREVVGWIVVMNGTQKGIDFRIYDGPNTLGAAADNGIVITDEYLSSKHATIRYEDGRYTFIDHDSTNGSFINEKRVNKEELIDNDTIRLGRTELRFKALY